MRFSPQQATTLLICFGILLRITLAGSIGLGVDESYAAAMARTLSLSYFDHPPLHFWLIWLAAHAGGEAAAVLRWPFILLFAGTTWMMYRLGAHLFSEWAGFYAALVLNISAVFSLSTGSWLLPDGPLMFFMLAAVLVLAHLIFSSNIRKPLAGWSLAGILVGLGLLSKYHAIFIAAGSFIYLLTTRHRRQLLVSPYPYLSMAVALVVFSPVIIWNQQQDWISFLFQGGRGAASGIYPERLLGNIAGQAAWILPWIWLPLVWNLGKTVLHGPASAARQGQHDRSWFLGCLAAGPVLVFTAAVLWGAQGLFHWQAPGYLLAFPLLGRDIADNMATHRSAIQKWLRGSAIAFLILVTVLGTHTANGWLKRAAPQWFSAGDPSLEALDWRGLELYLRDSGLVNGRAAFIASSHWIDAGKIDYALGGTLPVLCLSEQPHHFAFRHNQAEYKGKDALLIGRRQVMSNVYTVFGPYFSTIEPVEAVKITRGGMPEIDIAIFYARNFSGAFPLPYGSNK